jgi:G3E family GTPase
MALTPVTIFSGYLGSGKTTIILNALKQYPTPKNFAMIKNEFGDKSVDGALAQLSNLAVKELVNGCLCCILVGSLNDAVNELIEKQKPERIIIEASGNALPFPIILELKKNPNVYVDGVISVVDCVNFEKVKDTSMVAREQAKHTDLIIFNKVNLVDDDKLYRVKEDIFGINPDTSKIETTDGMVDPTILFGIDHIDNDLELTAHAHEHDLETFSYETSAPIDRTKLEAVLAACSPQSFFRIKAIVACTDQKTYLINGVFGKYTYEPLDISYNNSRIIFIGKNIIRLKEMLYDYLDKSTCA